MQILNDSVKKMEIEVNNDDSYTLEEAQKEVEWRIKLLYGFKNVKKAIK